MIEPRDRLHTQRNGGRYIGTIAPEQLNDAVVDSFTPAFIGSPQQDADIESTTVVTDQECKYHGKASLLHSEEGGDASAFSGPNAYKLRSWALIRFVLLTMTRSRVYLVSALDLETQNHNHAALG
jgi:hypothetical protein